MDSTTAPAASGPSRCSRFVELLVGFLGLVAALAVLPLPTVAVTPEIASVLAISAVALLAGQGWALALVVLADIALIGALWPRAFLHDPPSLLAQVGVGLGLAGALPGALAIGRAAPTLAELLLGAASRRARVATHALVVGMAAVWLASPLL